MELLNSHHHSPSSHVILYYIYKRTMFGNTEHYRAHYIPLPKFQHGIRAPGRSSTSLYHIQAGKKFNMLPKTFLHKNCCSSFMAKMPHENFVDGHEPQHSFQNKTNGQLKSKLTYTHSRVTKTCQSKIIKGGKKRNVNPNSPVANHITEVLEEQIGQETQTKWALTRKHTKNGTVDPTSKQIRNKQGVMGRADPQIQYKIKKLTTFNYKKTITISTIQGSNIEEVQDIKTKPKKWCNKTSSLRGSDYLTTPRIFRLRGSIRKH